MESGSFVNKKIRIDIDTHRWLDWDYYGGEKQNVQIKRLSAPYLLTFIFRIGSSTFEFEEQQRFGESFLTNLFISWHDNLFISWQLIHWKALILKAVNPTSFV